MLRFLDSFDHLTIDPLSGPPLNGNALQKWTSKGTTGIAVVANGRNGQGLKIFPGSAISKTIDQQVTWIIGWAVMFLDTGAQPGPNMLFLANINTTLFNLQHNADSTFSLYAGNTLNLIGTSSFSTRPNIWYYLEAKVSFSGSNPILCTATFKVDGSTKVSGAAPTGVNIANLIAQTATANFISLGSSGSTGGIIIDDVYMFDASGIKNNDFAGDIEIGVVFPDGDVLTQWTPNGISGGHFKCVNENPPDGDSTYISDSVAGHDDNFTWQDISSLTGVIKGLQYSAYARKDDEGTRTIKLTIQNANALSQQFFLNDDYNYYSTPMDTDSFGADWTVASFNAATFGVRLFS
jgi:hypothetical protein